MLPVFLFSCSVERKNPLSKTYHNILAHYNGYFLAREKMKTSEEGLRSKMVDDYNRVLPIYPDVTESTASAMQGDMDEIIKKASIPIQRHKNSRWVDDSYVLLGKARYYQYDFENAIQTFKYVNTEGEDDAARHQALIWLMHTFMDQEEYGNVIAVADYLKKEELNHDNLRDFHLALAHYYYVDKNWSQVARNIEAALPYVQKHDRRARLNFILGQIYQNGQRDSTAYDRYQAVLRNSPPYELSFYTKLNMSQVTELSEGSDVRRIQKYFRKLLRDQKNKEYKDRIYYEMARFELKQDNVEKAVDYLQKSVQQEGGNPNQKAYSYLELGKVYYDRLRNFERAKVYYDSTLMFMNQELEEYEAISKRQQVLEEFVGHYYTMQHQDSLRKLAAMDSIELYAVLDKILDAEEARREAEAKALARAERRAQNRAASVFDMSGDGGFETGGGAGSSWYFYDTRALSQGQSAFQRTWGSRPLEDNWRRSNKNSDADFDTGEPVAGAQAPAADSASATASVNAAEVRESRRSELLANIPTTPEALAASDTILQTALYELGRIYDQRLDEPKNAATTFERLIDEFPENENYAEVLYFLHLIYSQLGDEAMAAKYREALTEKFGNSIYAKKLNNPNYAEESRQRMEAIAARYKVVYELYEQAFYDSAQAGIDAIQVEYPTSEFEDRLALLEALILGRTEKGPGYQQALEQFINTYPTSSLVDYAQQLLDGYINQAGQADLDPEILQADPAELEEANAEAEEAVADLSGIKMPDSEPVETKATPPPAPAKPAVTYSENLQRPHYFVAVFHLPVGQSRTLTENFARFNDDQFSTASLSSSPLMLDDSTFAVIVKEFPSKDQAVAYLQKHYTEASPTAAFERNQYDIFVISNENFPRWYKSKGTEGYLAFFREHYR
ncbi:tetratricopeptide repeat protein [Catalinimonas alkaloidigena]|nr:tetratricopeptide repeat protein [Catalinimonas alkaloidigena]